MVAKPKSKLSMNFQSSGRKKGYLEGAWRDLVGGFLVRISSAPYPRRHPPHLGLATNNKQHASHPPRQRSLVPVPHGFASPPTSYPNLSPSIPCFTLALYPSQPETAQHEVLEEP